MHCRPGRMAKEIFDKGIAPFHMVSQIVETRRALNAASTSIKHMGKPNDTSLDFSQNQEGQKALLQRCLTPQFEPLRRYWKAQRFPSLVSPLSFCSSFRLSCQPG